MFCFKYTRSRSSLLGSNPPSANWAYYSPLWCFHFLTCKMGKIIIPKKILNCKALRTVPGFLKISPCCHDTIQQVSDASQTQSHPQGITKRNFREMINILQEAGFLAPLFTRLTGIFSQRSSSQLFSILQSSFLLGSSHQT